MPDREEVIRRRTGGPSEDFFCPVQVRVQWGGSNDVEVSLRSSNNAFGVELMSMVKQAFSSRPKREIKSIFESSFYVVEISKIVSGQSRADSASEITPSLSEFIDDLYNGRFKAEIEKAHECGMCDVSFELFDLTFVSWHRQAVDIQQQYKEAQEAREEIDAQRAEWLHTQAEPLLDEMESQLLDASLPYGYRDNLSQLRETLRNDAYKYSSLIDADTAKKIFNLSYSRFQTLVQEGRLGHSISRFYVHCEEEVRRVAAKERRHGRPPS